MPPTRNRDLFAFKPPTPYSKNMDRQNNAMGDGISNGFAQNVQAPRSNRIEPLRDQDLLDKARMQRAQVINGLKDKIFKARKFTGFSGMIDQEWNNQGPIIAKQKLSKENSPYHSMAFSRQINRNRDFMSRTYKYGQ